MEEQSALTSTASPALGGNVSGGSSAEVRTAQCAAPACRSSNAGWAIYRNPQPPPHSACTPPSLQTTTTLNNPPSVQPLQSIQLSNQTCFSYDTRSHPQVQTLRTRQDELHVQLRAAVVCGAAPDRLQAADKETSRHALMNGLRGWKGKREGKGGVTGVHAI